jgi:hypothetical protein
VAPCKPWGQDHETDGHLMVSQDAQRLHREARGMDLLPLLLPADVISYLLHLPI